jgi:hypothetical protein
MMKKRPEVGGEVVWMYCLVNGALLGRLTPAKASSMIQISEMNLHYVESNQLSEPLTSRALGDLHGHMASPERIEFLSGHSYHRQETILCPPGEDVWNPQHALQRLLGYIE